MKHIPVLLFCGGLIAVFLFGGCAAAPAESIFESESVASNAVEQQTGQMLSDSASDSVSDITEVASREKADSVAEEQDPLAWEDIDWSQYDPQMVMLGQEIAYERGEVRRDWQWKKFHLMTPAMESKLWPDDESAWLQKSPTVLPDFPTKRLTISEKLAEYLSAPYLLRKKAGGAGALVEADGRIVRGSPILAERYRSEPVNACCAESVRDPHYVFLTKDGTFVRGAFGSDETYLLYDFGLDAAAVDKAIKLEQFGIDVRGSMIFVQFGDAVYCHYIPTGETVHLFSVKNLKSFYFHNSCECSYTVHSEEYVAQVEAGFPDPSGQILGSPLSSRHITSIATEKTTMEIIVEETDCESYVFWMENIRKTGE